MGNALIVGGTNDVKGVIGDSYGGADAMDSSCVLKKVRVWYGSSVIRVGNEINGIALAGVGTGTLVEHCEVASTPRRRS